MERLVHQLQQRRLVLRSNLDDQTAGFVAADMGVEDLAEARRQGEDQEVWPETVAQLHEATFAVLEELVVNYPRTAEAVLQIQAHLRRWLGATPDPTSGVLRALVAAEPSAAAIALRQEVALHLHAELNPLLRHLQVLAGSQTQSIDVIDHLTRGRADGQVTTTVFGVIGGWSTAEARLSRQLIVLDPLSSDPNNIAYIQERLRCREIYGQESESLETQLAQFCSVRSDSAVYELLQAATGLAPTDRVRRAYETLADFIEIQQLVVEERFREGLQQTDFVHGNQAQVFGLLNAAEVVKQANPQLFARLLGVTGTITVDGAREESGRSDLYGNLFHVAFAHTQQMRGVGQGQVLPGLSILRDRLKGLTEVTTEQVPLQAINRPQLEALAQQLKAELHKPTAATDGNQDSVRNPVLITMLTSLVAPRAAELQLADLLNSVSIAERELTYERLAVCGPREFYHRINALPEDQLSDPVLEQVLGERLPFMLNYDKLLRHCSVFLGAGQHFKEIEATVRPFEQDNEIGNYVVGLVQQDPMLCAVQQSYFSPVYDQNSPLAYFIRELIKDFQGDASGLPQHIASRIFEHVSKRDSRFQVDSDQYHRINSQGYVADAALSQKSNLARMQQLVSQDDPRAIVAVIRASRSVRFSAPDIETYHKYLWQTAGERAILSDDFFQFCVQHLRQPEIIASILNAHQDISVADWETWARRQMESNKTILESIGGSPETCMKQLGHINGSDHHNSNFSRGIHQARQPRFQLINGVSLRYDASRSDDR